MIETSAKLKINKRNHEPIAGFVLNNSMPVANISKRKIQIV